jgi:hypothetical protein
VQLLEGASYEPVDLVRFGARAELPAVQSPHEPTAPEVAAILMHDGMPGDSEQPRPLLWLGWDRIEMSPGDSEHVDHHVRDVHTVRQPAVNVKEDRPELPGVERLGPLVTILVFGRIARSHAVPKLFTIVLVPATGGICPGCRSWTSWQTAGQDFTVKTSGIAYRSAQCPVSMQGDLAVEVQKWTKDSGAPQARADTEWQEAN